MATVNNRLFLISVSIFAFIEFANCLQCFTCSSAREDICDDVFSHHAYQSIRSMTCESSPPIPIPGAYQNTHCGKSKNQHSRSLNDYVFRGCVPENYCKLINSTNTDECAVCDQDNCNLAIKTSPSIITCVTTVFAFFKFTYL